MVEVQQNPNSIGYDGLGYVTNQVKMVAVARDATQPFVLPGIQSVTQGTYAIARDLYMYTPGQSAGKIAQYLEWIVGPAGQAIVGKLGFVPLGAASPSTQ
jgi:phosphate transport system substrate-binding protein